MLNPLKFCAGSLNQFFHSICDVSFEVAVTFSLISLGNVSDILFCACGKNGKKIGSARARDGIICDACDGVCHGAAEFGADLCCSIGEKNT